MMSFPKMFSLAVHDDDDDDDNADNAELPNHDADDAELPIPFPTSASAPSSPRPSSSSLRPSPVRTASTPVLLSNGKPLKSSLKSSSSAPHIALPPLHFRARSAPSTPHPEPISKNVRFPTDELATVRTFSRSARPASLLARATGDDTETETDGELSGAPAILRASSAVAVSTRSPLITTQCEIDIDQSSPVPMKNPPSHAHALLESIVYSPRSTVGTPHRLSGTLVVRNIAYEKVVAVRFTLDDWQTTSEVSARHLTSLHAFPLVHSGTPSDPMTTPQWDRFGFTIRLEDYAAHLAKRTLFLVVRYIAHPPAGPVETWDNNLGQNYKVVFKDSSPTPRLRGFTVSSPRACLSLSNPIISLFHFASFQPLWVQSQFILYPNVPTLLSGNSACKTTPPRQLLPLRLSTIILPAVMMRLCLLRLLPPLLHSNVRPSISFFFFSHLNPPSLAFQFPTSKVRIPSDPIPILTFSSSSSSSSSPSSSSSNSPESTPNLTPMHSLQMGTSPPFSTLPEYTSSTKSIINARSRPPVGSPWTLGADTQTSKSPDQVHKLLQGIREKSTSSPVRSGRSSPVKRMASPPLRMGPHINQIKQGVVSPQPRKDWSKVGSGWNSPRAAVGIGLPRASPILINTSSAKSAVVAATAAATPKSDSIYQTVVRQWCFAQGSSTQGQQTNGRGDGAGLVV